MSWRGTSGRRAGKGNKKGRI
jgi:hypothetical protein